MEYEMLRALRPIRCFLLDMDGTIFLGNKLLPKADEFIEYLKTSGRGFLFLTNNSSKDKTAYVEKLSRLGIRCAADDILTSGEATCIYLKGRGIQRVYLLGTPELEAEFRRWGFELTAEKPDVVVIGFDKTLTYAKLVTACELLRQGVPYVATHPDINCPMVVLVADDPGPISSQTEQDTRHFAQYAHLPVFDPASLEDAYLLIGEAFAYSEKYHTPVIFRPTTQICHGP